MLNWNLCYKISKIIDFLQKSNKSPVQGGRLPVRPWPFPFGFSYVIVNCQLFLGLFLSSFDFLDFLRSHSGCFFLLQQEEDGSACAGDPQGVVIQQDLLVQLLARHCMQDR